MFKKHVVARLTSFEISSNHKSVLISSISSQNQNKILNKSNRKWIYFLPVYLCNKFGTKNVSTKQKDLTNDVQKPLLTV